MNPSTSWGSAIKFAGLSLRCGDSDGILNHIREDLSTIEIDLHATKSNDASSGKGGT